MHVRDTCDQLHTYTVQCAMSLKSIRSEFSMSMFSAPNSHYKHIKRVVFGLVTSICSFLVTAHYVVLRRTHYGDDDVHFYLYTLEIFS